MINPELKSQKLDVITQFKLGRLADQLGNKKLSFITTVYSVLNCYYLHQSFKLFTGSLCLVREQSF